MIGNFLGNCKKPHSYVNTDVATFGNIWSSSGGHTGLVF